MCGVFECSLLVARRPEFETVSDVGLDRQPDVIDNPHPGKQLDGLIRAANAESATAVHGLADQLPSQALYATCLRPQFSAQKRNQGAFTRPIGADDRVHFVRLHIKAYAVNRVHPAKVAG